MTEFCEIYNLENLVNKPTCFKKTINPSCIDLILTNRKDSFQETIVLETGISDHLNMIVTTLKACSKKQSPKIITYRIDNSFIIIFSQMKTHIITTATKNYLTGIKHIKNNLTVNKSTKYHTHKTPHNHFTM